MRVGGRVRSPQAQDDALRAAIELLEEGGYAAVTVEGVAARSGVAKSTIYRWWANRADLVLEALGRLVAERMPAPDTGDLEADLTVYVSELYRVVEHSARMRALSGLMAEAQLDPAFAVRFRAWVQTRRDVLTVILGRGLPAGADLEHAADLVFGPFWYRLLVGHAPLDPADAPGHVRQVLHGLAQRQP